jgi:hypothetical protein
MAPRDPSRVRTVGRHGESEYRINERGQHELWIITAWSPSVPVLEKIVTMFPALALDVHSHCEMGNYFIKGTIGAGDTDLKFFPA